MYLWHVWILRKYKINCIKYFVASSPQTMKAKPRSRDLARIYSGSCSWALIVVNPSWIGLNKSRRSSRRVFINQQNHHTESQWWGEPLANAYINGRHHKERWINYIKRKFCINGRHHKERWINYMKRKLNFFFPFPEFLLLFFIWQQLNTGVRLWISIRLNMKK